jgi:ABC-type sugar transport system ATPase subunit
MGESCDVWIFDEPTQGIDVDTKTEIYTIMSQLAQQGSAIWFISSDLRELTSICDRIYVMYDFAIAAEFTAPYEREDILTKMMGGD